MSLLNNLYVICFPLTKFLLVSMVLIHSILLTTMNVICVNKQMQASEEQVMFLKKTVAGFRQRTEELEAAPPGAAESGRYYQLCAVLHYITLIILDLELLCMLCF